MLNTALKLVAQFVIARFIRSRMQDVHNQPGNNHLGGLKRNMAALLESHAALFKSEFNNDLRRVVNSLLALTFISVAAICSGLTGLMWLFATAWKSPYRDVILGTAMILPIIISIGVYLVMRQSWKKQPLLSKSMVQIEQDWQVFKGGLDGTADTSEEANR